MSSMQDQLPKQLSSSTDEVEALARVLCDAARKSFSFNVWEKTQFQDGFRLAARAALDWMGATVGKCKECEKLRKRGDKLADDCVKLAGAIKNARAAQKEEGMLNPYDPNVTVEELKVESALLKRAAALRAHYDAAYLAALGGTCADPNVGDESLAIRFAKDAAIQSVRTHAARMQELERLIEEVVG